MKKLFLLLLLSPYVLAEESILECRMIAFIQDNGELNELYGREYSMVLPFFFVINTEKKEIEYSVDSGDLRDGRNQKQYNFSGLRILGADKANLAY